MFLTSYIHNVCFFPFMQTYFLALLLSLKCFWGQTMKTNAVLGRIASIQTINISTFTVQWNNTVHTYLFQKFHFFTIYNFCPFLVWAFLRGKTCLKLFNIHTSCAAFLVSAFFPFCTWGFLKQKDQCLRKQFLHIIKGI